MESTSGRGSQTLDCLVVHLRAVSRILQKIDYLWLPHKNPTILFAGEVALALHRSIILAFGLVQNDSHPFPWGKERGANVGHCATLLLPYHLHQGAHFDGPATPIWAHPAAATAGGLGETEKQKDKTDIQWKMNTLENIVILLDVHRLLVC